MASSSRETEWAGLSLFASLREAIPAFARARFARIAPASQRESAAHDIVEVKTGGVE